MLAEIGCPFTLPTDVKTFDGGAVLQGAGLQQVAAGVEDDPLRRRCARRSREYADAAGAVTGRDVEPLG